MTNGSGSGVPHMCRPEAGTDTLHIPHTAAYYIIHTHLTMVVEDPVHSSAKC